MKSHTAGWCLVLFIACVLVHTHALAEEFGEELPEAGHTPMALPVDDTKADDFALHIARQAALELQIGLTLYKQRDDYRAIGSLKRYQILDPRPEAAFAAALMIGQIYQRNSHPDLAIFHFEQAFQSAAATSDGVFAYMLAVQEMCLSLSLYGECYRRLNALSQVELGRESADLVRYQLLYSEVVLRSPHLNVGRLETLSTAQFREHGHALLARHQAFDALALKRPWLAGTISAVLPGAGQAYNGRWIDAAIAFGFNATFGAASYYAFAHADSPVAGAAFALLGAGFYIGNIVNAVVDAQNINARRYQDFFESLERDHWPRLSFGINDDQVQFHYRFGQDEADEVSGPPTPPAPTDSQLDRLL
ncbi:MAG: hypothetical protein H0U74_22760 [Bradymonadaceae bacterium]|nr:hypothetical protein [Lujinxingiaceae bacterium]